MARPAIPNPPAIPETPTREHIIASRVPRDPEAVAELPILPEEYLEPWDRRPEESASDWRLFTLYRDMIPPRRLKTIAEEHGYSPKTLFGLSKKFSWQDRVRSWDQHQDLIYRANLVREIRNMAGRHAEVVAEGIETLLTPFRAIAERGDDFIDELSAKDAKVLLSLATRAAATIPSMLTAERLSRGLPTEVHQVNVQGEVVHRPDPDAIADIVESLAATGVLDEVIRVRGALEIVDAEVEPVYSDDPDP